MKRLVQLAIVFALVVWAGCSSNNNGPTGPGPTPPVRVVANTSVAAPTLSSADEAVWNSVTKVAVDISPSNPPKILPPTSLSAPDSVTVQAISDGTDLYLRISYRNDSLNLLKNYNYIIGDSTNVNFDSSTFSHEDQLYVMFAGLPNSAWDVWNWRSLETAPAKLAEGYIFRNDSLIRDTGGQEVALRNALTGARPQWVHNTGPAYHGEILYIEDTSNIAPFLTSTWTGGQIVPGYVIDTAVGGRVQIGQPYASSRWDIFSVYSYNSTTDRLAVVMKSRLTSTYADDLDLVDSVKIKVGVFDDQSDFTLSGSRRGFTKEFWLIL